MSEDTTPETPAEMPAGGARFEITVSEGPNPDGLLQQAIAAQHATDAPIDDTPAEDAGDAGGDAPDPVDDAESGVED